MNNSLPEMTLFSSGAHSAGFRLERFELFNWGAFHKTVYVLPLAGENALLTGANGAGKTTLVDALITLLNPTPERYYNQSAGSEDKKRTRRLEDYVRGVYGHSATGREELRPAGNGKETFTVLLGVFYNRDLDLRYTLAHLYWFNGNDLQKRFYTAPVNLDIQTHFPFQGDIRKFNSFITKSAKAQPFEFFSEFAQDFQAKLGMRQPERTNSPTGRTKPLHLLAKTAGIKVLGNLNAFIREQMLDEASMEDAFDALKKQYADIAETQNTLDKASQQEDMLAPLYEFYSEWQVKGEELLLQEGVSHALRPWFARHHADLLERYINELKLQQAQATSDLAALDDRLEQLRDEEKEVDFNIKNNNLGRQLKDLEIQQKQLENLRSKQQTDAEHYARLATSLDLQPDPGADLFYVQLGQLKKRGESLHDESERQRKLRDDLVTEKNQRETKRREFTNELESLRSRSSNIPSDLVGVRYRLCHATGIPETELPFAGELVQVRQPERAIWEKALEKLVRPFALFLLVPPRHLRSLVQWVRNNDLGLFLRFIEADDEAGPALFNDVAAQVAANKLEVQPKSPFASWLQQELTRRYSHFCTEDTTEYERKKLALTPEGLIRNDKQHQKDDRRHSSDEYVLGWDNKEKIRRIEDEIRTLENQLRQYRDRIQHNERIARQLDVQLAGLGRLGEFTDFRTIDFRTTETEIQQVVARIEELNRTSSELKFLQDRLKKIQADFKSSSHDRDGLLRRSESLKNKINERLITLQRVRTDAQAYNPAVPGLESFVAEMPELSLDTINAIEKERLQQLNTHIHTLKERRNNLKVDMERLMYEFKNPKKAISDKFPSWPNDAETLGEPRLDNAPEYLGLLERIQNDQLPALRERYSRRASQDVGNAMQVFQQQLEEQLQDHKDNVLNINRSLRALHYTHDSYLQVVMDENFRKGRVGEFYALLREWDYDRAAFQIASENERLEIWRQTVERIGALIKRLDENPDWRKEVTDVRNWLSFKTQQKYIHDDSSVAGTLQDSTSGKSGGEQAKLTYTVLAAALTYQFNISADSRNARSFRFIAVDEAFSKLDPENSAYLLDLLEKLHFQMLIITPNTGLAIGQDRMSHLIFVQKKQEMPPESAVYVYSIKELAAAV